jgi:hypothetical protein
MVLHHFVERKPGGWWRITEHYVSPGLNLCFMTLTIGTPEMRRLVLEATDRKTTLLIQITAGNANVIINHVPVNGVG